MMRFNRKDKVFNKLFSNFYYSYIFIFFGSLFATYYGMNSTCKRNANEAIQDTKNLSCRFYRVNIAIT